eukprot:gnl/Dysnectes_brevis/1298_a1454_3657.p1 GENE.gnl/Dysnectes_brevis/1298_a1454_3657~~gnl/Dysnectes_brevis/1298_a1454_3657.p1  ORF type:complete len:225 (-),score=54.20 gnl/Dysnectes_brevis/1298_a1454_3657:81-755(-)
MPTFTFNLPIPDDVWELAKASGEESIMLATDLLNSDGWKNEKPKGDVEIETKSIPGSKFKALRSSLNVPFTPEQCLQHMVSGVELRITDPVSKRTDYIHRTMLRGEGEPHEMVQRGLMYMALGSGSIVKPRSFLMTRRVHHDAAADTLMLIHRTFTHESIPHVKGVVRGTMHIQMVAFTRTEEGCIARFCVHSNPMGRVPAVIYNRVLLNQAVCLARMRDELSK